MLPCELFEPDPVKWLPIVALGVEVAVERLRDGATEREKEVHVQRLDVACLDVCVEFRAPAYPTWGERQLVRLCLLQFGELIALQDVKRLFRRPLALLCVKEGV